MKKLCFTLLCGILLFSAGAGAATGQYSRKLSPFSGVDISGPFEVRMVRGSEYRALLSYEDAYDDYVTCDVVSGILVLSLDERRVPSEVKRQFRGKGTPDPVFSAVIYVPELIQTLSMSGKSVLYDTEDLFDKAKISFDLAENAVMKHMSVSTLNFKVSVRGKASADLTVGCKEFVAETANACVLKVEETSEVSNYYLQGSSRVTAKSETGALNVHTKSNCTMSITGSGNTAEFDINGTSEVDAFGFEVPEATVTMTSVCKLGESAYRSLKVNLSGGSSLYFANEPAVSIENIKSSTMARASGARGMTRL
ncbi:MAG: DUF2807 domain-containing protein [Bacteroidales bacterium]|nr:DUF2807 domain-containing protein [Bacteroidales bacterium]